MTQEASEVLKILKSELEFLTKGGYGRVPSMSWEPRYIFLDSPTCLNFNASVRRHPCNQCSLLDFVPANRRAESIPCWAIKIGPLGETVGDFYRCGTRPELEAALKHWL
ncbi:MAG: hypothetical protein ABSD20_15310, partial [Terriglobales bacterium]